MWTMTRRPLIAPTICPLSRHPWAPTAARRAIGDPAATPPPPLHSRRLTQRRRHDPFLPRHPGRHPRCAEHNAALWACIWPPGELTEKHCHPHSLDEATPIVDLLGCPIVDLPITYLGIPLMIRRPTAAQLQPVVDKTAGKLPGWKVCLMNKAGHLAYVKTVLSAIPVHQLLVLVPSKKTLKALVKIQRGFL